MCSSHRSIKLTKITSPLSLLVSYPLLVALSTLSSPLSPSWGHSSLLSGGCSWGFAGAGTADELCLWGWQHNDSVHDVVLQNPAGLFVGWMVGWLRNTFSTLNHTGSAANQDAGHEVSSLLQPAVCVGPPAGSGLDLFHARVYSASLISNRLWLSINWTG